MAVYQISELLSNWNWKAFIGILIFIAIVLLAYMIGKYDATQEIQICIQACRSGWIVNSSGIYQPKWMVINGSG